MGGFQKGQNLDYVIYGRSLIEKGYTYDKKTEIHEIKRGKALYKNMPQLGALATTPKQFA